MRSKRLVKILSLAAIAAGLAFLWRSYEAPRAETAQASASQNASGWAFSDMPDGSDEVKTPGAYSGRGAGWISFNNTNCDANDDGVSDGTPAGCPPAGTALARYGLHISPADGALSGQAWSEHMGWLSFNRSETGGPPAPPFNGSESFTAKMDLASKELSGWGRFLAGCQDTLWDGSRCTGSGAGDKSGDWDGWVKLRGPGYGLKWVPASAELEGWAWGDRNIGWISVNCKNLGSCGITPYRVKAVIDTVPPVVTIDQPNGVLNETTFTVRLTATDALTGIAEGDVDVKINDAGNPWVNDGLPGTPAGNVWADFEYTGARSAFYEFRFRAKDGAGNWSSPPVADGIMVINEPPAVPDPLSPEPSSPTNPVNTFDLNPSAPTRPVLSWSAFSDSDGDGKHNIPGGHAGADAQGGYHVQIATDDGFSTVVFDKNEAVASSEVVAETGLGFDKSYFWRVKVRDEHGLDSAFASAGAATGCRGVPGETCSFYTPPSSRPVAGFSFRPQNPSVGEEVLFSDLSADATDLASCPRGGCHVAAWEWNFGDADDFPAVHSTAQNPAHRYAKKGTYAVNLRAQDNDGQWSAWQAQSVGVRPELPEFKEVAPR